MDPYRNLLGTETRLPEDPAVDLLARGEDPTEVAAAYPTSSAAWAALADRALTAGRTVEAYAYARTGYHRGLDSLRRAGWKGQGFVPWAHEPNQGVLRATYLLMKSAAAIEETDEAARCANLLADSDPAAVSALSS